MTARTGSSARAVVEFDVTDWPSDQVAALIDYARELTRVAREELPPASADEGGEESSFEWRWDELLAVYAELRNSRSYPQIKVLERMAANGGQITREETYAATGFGTGRSLKGFTRPFGRVVAQLEQEHRIRPGLPDLVTPVYEDGTRGYQRAQGFRMPPNAAALIRRGKSEVGSHDS